MPNWEHMANQMGQPFGGLPQPQQQPQMDVQGLVKGLTGLLFGGVMPPAPGANPAYQPPPASETWRKAVSIGADFAPVIGDIKSGQEAITGKNLLTGENYNWWERGLAGLGALPFIPNVAAEIKAFHGSPHKFDKFKAEKIGTGEGAQAFGHGLYFTSEKDIAKHYGKTFELDGKFIDRATVAKLPNVGELSKVGRLKETENIYSVTLHKGKQPGEYDYLKWDSSISEEQIKKINIQLEKEGNPFGLYREGFKESYGRGIAYQRNGEGIYKHLSENLGGRKEASAFLLRAGIDGIEYPAGSLGGYKAFTTKRTVEREGYSYGIIDAKTGQEVEWFTGKNAYEKAEAWKKEHEPKNWVVFDENAITIEGK